LRSTIGRRWMMRSIFRRAMYCTSYPDESNVTAGNSAVVLATVKVILYLMNYMSSERVVEDMCRRLSPSSGT
jgi:hypothetical protein